MPLPYPSSARRAPWWPLLLLPVAAVLRPLVSLLHEGGHALVVLATGGQIHAVTGASVAFSGGWTLGVLGAGYLAPALLGVGLSRCRSAGLRGVGGMLLLGALLDVLEDRGIGDAALLAASSGLDAQIWSMMWAIVVSGLCILAGTGILRRPSPLP